MLLAIDIGNTNIVIGVFEGKTLKTHWRVATIAERTPDEYGIILLGLLASGGLKKSDISGAIICSVVPYINGAFREALTRYIGVSPLVIGENGVNAGMPVLTDNPLEVGSDRIVNAVAAYKEHKTSLIVVDFGTAVTFDYVTDKGEYAGGAIGPGVAISAEALFRKTAKLPKIEVAKPSKVIGKNTIESMQSGVYWGFIGLIDGIIERMRKEAGGDPKIISTGGLAPLVIGESRFITDSDEFLTLKGLKIIYEGMR